MTTAIAERPGLGLAEWGMMREQAATLVRTGFLPPSIKTPEQVIAIALTGRELGIGMMEAIRGINVIQGKPSVSPQLMLALAIRTGQLETYSMKIVAGSAECIVKRKGWPEHKTTFGPAEAKSLGLDGKDNYRKQAAVMFKWRALAENLRFTFPDAVSGIYTFDEMGAEMNAEGDIQAEPQAPVDAIKVPQEVDDAIEIPRGISESERRLLFKLAKAAWGASYQENLRKYIHASFGTEHTSDLTEDQLERAIDQLKSLPPFDQGPLDAA